MTLPLQTTMIFPEPRINVKTDIEREKITALMNVLHTRRNWIKYKEIRQVLNISDRDVRYIAASSGGRIISGQKGYRLTEYATIDEITHAANWLKSAGMELIKRAEEIRNQITTK